MSLKIHQTALPHLVWVTAILLLLTGCSDGFRSTNTEEKKVRFTKAKVTLHRDEDNPVEKIVDKAHTLDKAEDVEKLVVFFPGVGTGRKSNETGAWLAAVIIELTDEDGNVHQVFTNYKMYNERKNQGDLPVKDGEGLKKHITALFKDK